MSPRPTSYKLFAASAALLLALFTNAAAQDTAAPQEPAQAKPADRTQTDKTQADDASQDAAKETPQDATAKDKAAGDNAGNKAGEKADAKKSDEKGAIPSGSHVFWRDPGDIASRDLKHGPGGEAMRPDLSRVTFVEEETGGYSPKFRVKDGAGRVWVAKFGKESQPETAASRIVWAVGFPSEITYLAPCVRIEGAPAPRKEVDRCEGGGFANVRFEARPDGVKRLDEWKWAQNPFAGTREMNGFVVLMAMINNWDLKDSNNKIVHMPDRGELHYVVSDLGATFGKTGNFVTHNRNEPKDYAKSRFVDKVEGGRVVFSYDGKNGGLLDSIPVADAKWVGSLLAKLSDQQIKDAFVAANYGPEEANSLTESVRAKITELTNLEAAAAPQKADQ